ncbi:gas vesicle accessory protein GvpU [Anthocerotibacter panamensis]|uniref:gas vesicle accessory protein GvpU n=1 Tax=Anthocerotibacter panamensis TaxID=2857077 RepID=UPI001C401FF3|nr:gas vesicle accessory protein GvpU [Anthocerotibacter panamensis]
MSATENHLGLTDEPLALDWLLQSLVQMVNTSEISFPVTLQVSGLLVSGYLTSGRQYFEEFAQTMGTTVVEEDQDEVIALFRELGKSFYAPQTAGPAPNPHFLHIRHARVFSPDGQPFPLQEGSWWRGRLEAVDGFMLGSLTAQVGERLDVTED